MKVAIVGAGIAGLSTAWSLVKQGVEVTLFEQGSIPNPLSASGDQHRLIRRAYGGMDGYAQLIDEAFDAWDELWEDLGESHLANRGVIAINQYPNDLGLAFLGSLRRHGHPFTTLRSEEAAERYPFLDSGTFREAYHSPDGGPLLCQKIGSGLTAWLEQHGVALHPHTRVVAVDGATGTVTLDGCDALAFDRVVVTAGAWVLRLFPELADRLTVCRTTAVYVAPPEDLRTAWRIAPAVQSIGGILSGYILPPAGGTELKFAAGSMRRLARNGDADADREALPDEGEMMRNLFAPPLVRVKDYEILRTITCTYTFTEDLRFLSQPTGRALIVSACSGHGYKFGAAVGRRVADAVLEGDTDRLSRWLSAEDFSPRKAT
jgi:sarcosine oxidase